jgi:hypothetical protein
VYFWFVANRRGSESLGGQINEFISDLIVTWDYETALLAFKGMSNG